METPSRPAHPSEPQPRRPWIFGRVLAGFVVLLVIVAGGAGVGWYIRQQTLRIDTAAALKAAGPAVVRVLATTCAGSGEASGVLIDKGRVLTATSAVDQPKSIVVVAPDGRIRRANLIGTSADGVAVLQTIGFEGSPLTLPPVPPDPKAERALIGYTAAGKQVVNAIGSEAEPAALSQFMNAAKLGGPVVDKSGRLIGLVTGDTVQASTVVPFTKLQGYVATAPSGLAVGTLGECAQSRGPQGAVTPELLVAGTPLALEVRQLLAGYLTLENQQDFAALQALYSPRYAKGMTEAVDREKHQTTYFFNPRITDLAPDGSSARMAYNVMYSPNAKGAGDQNCSRLDTRFALVRSRGKLVIDATKALGGAPACDT
ncbi:serine protease [Kribbella sp. NPDC003505]|uniref:S1 family peptidase n=1 Tax=Kribbella sp. NPDC003505 TaxID=3154448 RepID=UPI0033A486CE